MFNILLYSRVLITIILILLILYFIFNRFRQLGNEENIQLVDEKSVFSSENIQRTMDEDMSEISHDEDIVQDNANEDMAEQVDTHEVKIIVIEQEVLVTIVDENAMQEKISEQEISEKTLVDSQDTPIEQTVPSKQYEYIFS